MKKLLIIFYMFLFFILPLKLHADTFTSTYATSVTLSVNAGDFLVVMQGDNNDFPGATISDTDTNLYVDVVSTGGLLGGE